MNNKEHYEQSYKKMFCLVYFGVNTVNLKEWELEFFCLPKIMYSIRKYQSIEII